MNKEISNYKLCEQTIALKNTIEQSYLLLGKNLLKIRDEELFQGQSDSFDEFVQSQMKMSKGTASKVINIYKVFIVDHGMEPEKVLAAGGWSVLAEYLPVIKNKQDAEDALNEATHLSGEDRRKEIRERKTGISQNDCKHDFYTLKICRTCGYKEKIYEGEEL